MPIFTYDCNCGNNFEIIFPTFTDAEQNSEKQRCPKCNKLVKKNDFDTPALPLHLYGKTPGFHRPSATKRESYKVCSLRNGNRDSGA